MAAGLRSMPARFLFMDEVDAYDDDVDGKGSPINLAIKRTATFSRNRKILMASTPNIAETSKIEAAYEASDKRRYLVPCNSCGNYQPIVWAQIIFDNHDPATSRFECVHCGHKHYVKDKPKLLSNGHWQAETEKSSKVAGFHLSSLYSPNGWYSWQNAVEDF
ncbi:phage terminase large subunit family protein [Endozoicomonas sp. YOMI1]|uniref:phage terminase large subunit family protein n=1 Tax=Endozoicomonas sp. YOMI1 TaxID=2828739 RepID=UPI0035A03E40